MENKNNPFRGCAIYNITGGQGAIDSDGNCVMLNEGHTPPTEKAIATEIARLEAQAQAEKTAQKLQQKAHLNNSYVKRQQRAARDQAIDELIGPRKAELLAQKDANGVVTRARKRAAEYQQQAKTLETQKT